MKIEIEKLINLDIFSYLLCYCLLNKENNILESYVTIHKIPTLSIKKAIDNGYLTTTSTNDVFTISNLFLTDKFKNEFFPDNKGIDFEFAWKQILIHYPSKVINSGETRYLHTDLDNAKQKYKKYITVGGIVNEEEHSFVLQAINHLVNIKRKSGSLGYMTGISVYINQKNWNAVRSDVMEIIRSKGFVENKNNEGGFLEDV